MNSVEAAQDRVDHLPGVPSDSGVHGDMGGDPGEDRDDDLGSNLSPRGMG